LKDERSENGTRDLVRSVKGEENDETLQDEPGESLPCPKGRELEYYEALIARAQFRRALQVGITELAQQNIPTAKTNLENAMAQMKIIRDSMQLGEVVSGRQCQLIRAFEEGFDPSINRKLFVQAPPRPIANVSKEEAVENTLSMLADLLEICEAAEAHPYNITFALSIVQRFAAKTPSPNVLARSLLRLNVVQQNMIFGQVPVEDAIKESVMGYSQPPYFESSDPDITARVSRFLKRSGDLFIVLVRTLCYNRARQRRRLCKLVVEWEYYQEEIEIMDQELQERDRPAGKAAQAPYYLSSWIYNHKLNMLAAILLIGFELDLYSDYEQTYVFLYLEYLYDTQLRHAYRVESVIKAAAARPKGKSAKSHSVADEVDAYVPGPDAVLANAKKLIFMGLFE
ncbi:hypothetical protein BDK51DRAFT_33435, partial [Blyttiomyces helicus]